MQAAPATVLVAGHGSIGRRHAGILRDAGHGVVVLTSHPSDMPGVRFISTIEELEAQPAACLVCTPTGLHLETFERIVQATSCRRFLVEKPLEMDSARAGRLAALATRHGCSVQVAYNLRYVELARKLRSMVNERRSDIRRVRIRCGQYLPEWRPGRELRETYSGRASMGGGADLDLSHEVDLMLWMFGEPQNLLSRHALRLSRLEIDTVDWFKGLYQYPGFVVDVELDCLGPRTRQVEIFGENSTLAHADLLEGRLLAGDRDLDCGGPGAVAASYAVQAGAFMGGGAGDSLCSLEESLAVLRWIGR